MLACTHLLPYSSTSTGDQIEIKKAVITSAGKATRMRPISNVIPKGLLPVFKTFEGNKYPTPIIDLIIESLEGAGAHKFCFVVGTKNRLFIDYLFGRNVTFVFQDEPKGFGDAVLRAEEFVGAGPFFLHVDDDFLTGGYKEGAEIFKELDADCLMFLSKVENPKSYGVVETGEGKEMFSHHVFKIKGVEEKPQVPKSDLVASGVYIFSQKIFSKLKQIKTDGELQLTYGIDKLIKEEDKVYGMVLEKESWLGLGNPKDYFRTLNYSYTNL
jgi:dTDP-glucose pyrophosphorylase